MGPGAAAVASELFGREREGDVDAVLHVSGRHQDIIYHRKEGRTDRNEQLFSVPDLAKGLDELGFGPNVPGELFLARTVT